MIKILKKGLAFLGVAVVGGGLAFASTPLDTLSIWVMDNGTGSQKNLHKMVKKFHRETGVYVDVHVLDWFEAFDKISVVFENPEQSAVPDVVQLGSTWVPYFASLGQIRTIDFLMDIVDSSRFVVEGFRSSHIDGRPEIYSLPWFLDVRGIFANEQLFQQLGIGRDDVDSVSKFLGTLRGVAQKKLKGHGDSLVMPFALPSKNDWTGPQQMASFIWGNGGDFIVKTENGFRSGLLDSCTMEGIALFVKVLGDKELTGHSFKLNSSQVAELFVNSKVLFHYGTSEIIRQLEFPTEMGGLKSTHIGSDGVVVVPFPMGNAGSVVFVGGSHLAMPVKKDTTKYRLAEKLLVYLVRADNVDSYSRHVGFLPSDKSIIRIWDKDARYSQLIRNLEGGRGFPNIPEWTDIERVLIDMTNRFGVLFTENDDENYRNRKISRMILNAHHRIDEILGQHKKIDELATLQWIEQKLEKKWDEKVPDCLTSGNFFVKVFNGKILGAILVIVILSVLYICDRRFLRKKREKKGLG